MVTEGQSDNQAPRGLTRPPASAVTESDNILGADDSTSEAEEAQTTPDSEPGESENSPKRRKRSAETRIRRLTRRTLSMESELEEERRRSAELEAELERVRSGAKKPSMKDFDSEDEFAEAYAEWKSSQTPKKPKPRKQVQTLPQEELNAFMEKGAEKVGSAWGKAMDRAKASEFALNHSMLEYILDSDHGHAMFVALSKDPNQAQEIASEKGLAALELLQDLEDEVSKDEKPRDKQGKFKKPPPPGPSRLQSDASTSSTLSFSDVPELGHESGAKAANLKKFMQRRRKEHNETFGF